MHNQAETDSFNIEITDLSHDGRGIGRHDGVTVFVPGVLPGERCLVRPLCTKKNLIEAALLSITQTSPERVVPPCSHSACGGCGLAHLALLAQRAWKQKRLAETLRRIAGIADAPVEELLPCPAPVGWRNRTVLRFMETDPGRIRLAYCAAGSRETVPVQGCRQLDPRLEKLLVLVNGFLDKNGGAAVAACRELLLRCGDEGLLVVFLTAQGRRPPAALVKLLGENGASGVLLGRTGNEGPGRWEACETLTGTDTVTFLVEGLRFSVSQGAFFQVNSPVSPAFFRTIFTELDARPKDAVLDLYSGVGVTALLAAKHCRMVKGIDISPAAISAARNNAATNRIENSRFLEAPVGRLPKILARSPVDLVLLDPPRAGVEQAALYAISGAKPRRIVYVSCDPATLARDARQLARTGYRLAKAIPVEMFPDTPHVETIARFERK
jgi:23S rRNA (uracil1939-C5)-methyltransferase